MSEMGPGNAGGFVTLVLLINGLLILVAATVLLVSMPHRVQAALRRTRRTFDCWIGLALIVTVVLLPVNVVVLFVHYALIPWPLANEALAAAFSGEPDRSIHERMQPLRERHRAWYLQTGGTAEGALQTQKLLWDSWAVIVMGVLVLGVGSIWMLAKFYSLLIDRLLRESIAVVPVYRSPAKDSRLG